MSDRDRYPFAALLAVEALLVCLFALFCAPDASAQERAFTSEDTHRALDGASPLVVCVVRLESSFEPYAVGAQGEQGAVQLHPQGGMWPLFWSSFAYTSLPTEARSPWNPYQSVTFLEWALAEGYGSHWTAYRFCR